MRVHFFPTHRQCRHPLPFKESQFGENSAIRWRHYRWVDERCKHNRIKPVTSSAKESLPLGQGRFHIDLSFTIRCPIQCKTLLNKEMQFSTSFQKQRIRLVTYRSVAVLVGEGNYTKFVLLFDRHGLWALSFYQINIATLRPSANPSLFLSLSASLFSLLSHPSLFSFLKRFRRRV